MAQRVFVTGGTGRLGRAFVPKLLRKGYEVRVLTRKSHGSDEPHLVTGDLLTGENLTEAVHAVDVIVHLATTQGRRDIEATDNLIAAAKTAGNPHLIYMSIVGIDDPLLSYYRTKRTCEEHIKASSLPWTILRATQFHDLIYGICHAQRRLPVMFMPSKVAFQPIDVSEVADQLCELVARPESRRVPDMGGPLVQEAADLAKMYLRQTGRHRPVVPLPLPKQLIGDFRRHADLVPDRAVGNITFEQYLANRA